MMKYVRHSANGWSVRGMVMLVMGLLLTGFMTVHPSNPAHAGRQVPSDPVTLVIQKFEQPNSPGTSATGLPMHDADLAAMRPVSHVEFAVTKVPGIDATTHPGRSAAQNLRVGEALERVGGRDPTLTGTTNAQGKLTLGGLEAGLYVVEETRTPAGAIPTDPFLVLLPMQHPSNGTWLDTVYVYPKNAPVEVSLSVVDEDAVQLGDDIAWQIRASIPPQTSLSRYRIVNFFAAGVELDSLLADIQVALSTGSALVVDTDYRIASRTVDGRAGFGISFTAAGRKKLVQARQRHPDAQVHVTYNAPAKATGEHTNEVFLTVNEAKAVTGTATTKFGDLRVIIHEQDNPQNLIPGAVFQLYGSAEDAFLEQHPLTIAGANRWTTAADGSLHINGLRLSDFVNGLERDRSDPLFRPYFLKPVSFPDHWTGSAEPVAITLSSAEEVYEVTIEVESADDSSPSADADHRPAPEDERRADGIPGQDSAGSDGLASTGARSAGLILLALALVLAGLFAVRRRRISRGAV